MLSVAWVLESIWSKDNKRVLIIESKTGLNQQCLRNLKGKKTILKSGRCRNR